MHHIERKTSLLWKKMALLCSHSLMLPCGGSKKRLIRTRIRNSHIFANHLEINIFQNLAKPCKRKRVLISATKLSHKLIS
jgi:hypothetical protein